MAYLVSGKIRRDEYNQDADPAATIVTGADHPDEAREMARQKLSKASGHVVTVDSVDRVKRGDDKVSSQEFDDPWHQQTLVAFDLETTGLDPEEDYIVEFGFAVRKEDDFSEVTDFMVGDAPTMPKKAGDVNGITDDMFVDEPPLKDVFDEKVLPFLEEADALIAHNRGFDMSFLLHKMQEYDLEGPIPPCFCTKMMAKRHGGFTNNKLQTVRSEFGIRQGDAHRAGDDARVCGEVFLELARNMKYFHPPCSMRDAIHFFDQVEWRGDPPEIFTV